MEDSSKSSENENPEAKLEDDPTRFSKSLQDYNAGGLWLEWKFTVEQQERLVDDLHNLVLEFHRLSTSNRKGKTMAGVSGRQVTDNERNKVLSNQKYPSNYHKVDEDTKGGSPVAAKTTSKNEFVAEEEVPLFLYTSNRKPSLVKDSRTETDNQSSTSVLPVRDGLSALPKASNPFFHFESKPTKLAPSSSSTGVAPQEGQFPTFQRKPKRNALNWKSVQNSDIATLIRKTKRAM
ncbi:hypothetical protein RHGRI_000826 [Rhododendron griersonianum]|uniref:Uncharacterized protein n=1 Tax=Rhododendron griersonianum TaxID=479676 RepID=A0AAV6LJ18_9ERIC|nr:hypothetical protein RHGRI_000826 [Rhododendron griersonianum]